MVARRAAPIGCLNRVLPDSRSAAFAYVVYNLLGIGCPRRSRSLRCGEQCIASRSMSNGYITSPRSGKYTSRVVALPHRASPPPCLATIRARSRRCSITFSWPDVGAPRSLSSSFTKILQPPVECRQIPRPARALRQSREDYIAVLECRVAARQ